MKIKPIPILMYHQIDQAKKGTPFRSLSVRPKSFALQMWLLNFRGYKGLSMQDLMPYLRGEKTGKVVGITFDDGYLNNLTNALPVLKRYGFTSTVYVVSQRQESEWDLDLKVNPKPLMNDNQLKQWVEGGQEVGAHTQNHVNLKKVSSRIAHDEISKCRLDLESRLGVPVRHFCYPYGQYDNNTIDLVKQAGFLTATTVERRLARTSDDFLQLPRVFVGRHNHLLAFWSKVAWGGEDGR
jgi:peptidoglycan/xylan/chitin deacetylase (PgdA/CDA1 family)